MRRYANSWYIQEYLPENFERNFGKANPAELASIAKEKIPTLPNEVFSWPEEILHIILGEIAGFSEPTIFTRKQVAEANLICSNRESVENLRTWDQHFQIESIIPAILEHQPNWILQVVDPMITSAEGVFRFCPEHPGHRIIWQSPDKARR